MFCLLVRPLNYFVVLFRVALEKVYAVARLRVIVALRRSTSTIRGQYTLVFDFLLYRYYYRYHYNRSVMQLVLH